VPDYQTPPPPPPPPPLLLPPPPPPPPPPGFNSTIFLIIPVMSYCPLYMAPQAAGLLLSLILWGCALDSVRAW
jgi:hypothetical protein